MQYKLYILIALLLTTMSCKKEEPTIQQKEELEEQHIEYREILAPATKTTLPQTILYGDTINFEIEYLVNSADKFSRLQDTFQDTTITLKVYINIPLKFAYQVLINRFDKMRFPFLTNYSYVPPAKGKYIFKFWQEDNKYLVDTLEVL